MTRDELEELYARAIASTYGADPDAEIIDGREGSRYPVWMDSKAEARAVIAAQEAAGLVVVPREPTEAMLAKAVEAHEDNADFVADDWRRPYVAAYLAMLAAAKGAAP